MLLSMTFCSSARSHGSLVTSPPATLTSSPTSGCETRLTSAAPNPGSCVVSGARMTRTVPEKTTLRTPIGTRAPSTPVGVSSISAARLERQSISTSNAIANSPKSYARAESNLGGSSPALKLLSCTFFTRELFNSESAALRLSESAELSTSGVTRSSTYCNGTSPPGPTTAAYISASCRMASTPSTAVRRASPNPSLRTAQASAQRNDIQKSIQRARARFQPFSAFSAVVSSAEAIAEGTSLSNALRAACSTLPSSAKTRRITTSMSEKARRTLSLPNA
mmetsp:Transcript_19614/g.59397  ORF Transcript_19614/g.59397 Transcript_19614/m.59397 type:complete len:279 (+) Transcript_19614:635-1471(+)